MLNDILDDLSFLGELNIEERIDAMNKLRKKIHEYSPFKNEPVDCVQWIKCDLIEANDYNPNIVAPIEMELLKTSIENDGYTQPIVSWKKEEKYEVVDGFHRNKIGKEYDDINDRVHGYLPLVVINESQTDKTDRIASTIRHNRARGKHKIESMSEVVMELKRRNWTDIKISKELGMDQDEILRLCQISGLTEIFNDIDFSKSWDIGIFDEGDNIFIDDVEDTDYNSDDIRIYNTHDKWECLKAGFYDNSPKNISKEQGEIEYKNFLSDLKLFGDVLEKIITEWKYSCEHYLTNENMNRIAWLGQAAVCYHCEIPSSCRGGFNLLSQKQQLEANEVALKYLNKWLKNNNRKEVTLEELGY